MPELPFEKLFLLGFVLLPRLPVDLQCLLLILCQVLLSDRVDELHVELRGELRREATVNVIGEDSRDLGEVQLRGVVELGREDRDGLALLVPDGPQEEQRLFREARVEYLRELEISEAVFHLQNEYHLIEVVFVLLIKAISKPSLK